MGAIDDNLSNAWAFGIIQRGDIYRSKRKEYGDRLVHISNPTGGMQNTSVRADGA